MLESIHPAQTHQVCLTIYRPEHQERWLAVPETNGLYHVSTLGTVVSNHKRGRGKRGQALKPSKNGGGYRVVSLCIPDANGKKRQRTRYVHDLVMRSFIGPKPVGAVTCHWNDDKDDNRLANLRYDIMAHNMTDAKFNRRSDVETAESGIRAAVTCPYTGDVLAYLGDLAQYPDLFTAYVGEEVDLSRRHIPGTLTFGQDEMSLSFKADFIASTSQSALDANGIVGI
jgi:hypothetical protein